MSGRISRCVVLALFTGVAFGPTDRSVAADPPTRWSVAVTGQGQTSS